MIIGGCCWLLFWRLWKSHTVQLFHQHCIFIMQHALRLIVGSLLELESNKDEKHSQLMLCYGSLTDPLYCVLIGVCSLCRMCREHTMKGSSWHAVLFPRLMKIICLITALSVSNTNYTCTHKGRRFVHGVFWLDLGLSACLNEIGTLPLGST